jgi:hypothetical protein
MYSHKAFRLNKFPQNDMIAFTSNTPKFFGKKVIVTSFNFMGSISGSIGANRKCACDLIWMAMSKKCDYFVRERLMKPGQQRMAESKNQE